MGAAIEEPRAILTNFIAACIDSKSKSNSSSNMVSSSLLVLTVLLLAGAELTPRVGASCSLEPNHNYPSRLNKTTLLVCNDTKQERVCIVGAGSSAVHMGWLLRRRGFVNTVLFEREDRVGGKIWTHEPTVEGDIVRELSAAFLSPDYFEVRGLMDRFGQIDVPFSVSKMIQMHASNTTASMTPSKWYNEWVSSITGTTDAAANAKNIIDR